MELLLEITDQMLGTGEGEQLGSQYELRKSARGIVLNDTGDMAVQYLATHFFHKLPGGGVDLGETIEEALHREIMEEVGCEIEIVQPLGLTLEYRNKYDLLHISYCFVCRQTGVVQATSLSTGEQAEGMETIWMKPEKMLEKMNSDTPNKYEGHFILKREQAFLEKFLESRS